MNLGDRMKAYETATHFVLPVRMPVIIRLDGKAFHTLTRDCLKPFDSTLRRAMVEATLALLDEIPARVAYHQSDEVSLLLIDYNLFNSQQWFRGQIQKMASVAASIMGAEFSMNWGSPGYFDARVFAVPERDVENYFLWRQRDAMRNAISGAAQAYFPPAALHGLDTTAMIVLLDQIGVTFEEYPAWYRRGTLAMRGLAVSAPDFSGPEHVIQQFLEIEEQ